MTPYGVAARYPDEIAVDELITQAAIARTQTIYDFALSKVPSLHL
ncbi:hypothetical protein FACS1894109_05900 [Spirochaetia bacterium]|nr:hypothetical protein FACS1894109_05900 [Spirochaetia bacterium]